MSETNIEKYDSIKDKIQTGDLCLFSGTCFESKVIEIATGGIFSHVGVFFRQGTGLWIAEEVQEIGYHTIPASTKLQQDMKDATFHWGIAPDIVHQNTAKVMDVILEYRSTPALQPYGGIKTLLETWEVDVFGNKIDPDKVQAVCSTFAELCWKQCGITFNTLMSPSDFIKLVKSVTQFSL
jgi:hypothetical protein